MGRFDILTVGRGGRPLQRRSRGEAGRGREGRAGGVTHLRGELRVPCEIRLASKVHRASFDNILLKCNAFKTSCIMCCMVAFEFVDQLPHHPLMLEIVACLRP